MRKTKEQPVQILDFAIPDTTKLEAQVLADVVSESRVLDHIEPILYSGLFSDEDFRKAWETAVHINADGGEVNLFTLSTALGSELVTRIMLESAEDAGSLFMATERAKSLRDAAAKKRTYIATSAFLQHILGAGVTEQDILTARDTLSREVEGPEPLQTEKQIDTLIRVVEKEHAEIAELIAQGKSIRVTTGFSYLDTTINGGFKAGQLIVLAARPSVGKTALMLQIAKHAAETGNPAQIFSLEMTDKELAERLIFSTGNVKPYDLSRGRVNADAFQKTELELDGLPIYVNDFSRSLDEILSKMGQAVRKGRCKIAFIDYLGLLSDALNFGNGKLYQAIARVTGTLKAAAKRLQIPIVLLCQLNREQVREGRSPELFDLRDSGSIEQDADVVLMLESHYKTKEGQEFPLVAWLRKNRAGKRDFGYTFFPNESYSAFTEGQPIAPRGEEPEPVNPEPADLPPTINGLEDEDDELPF